MQPIAPRDISFRIIATTAVLGLTLALVPVSASATNKDVLESKNNKKVHTKDGSCVRTRWQAGEDPCAARIARAPEPEPYIAPPPPPPPPPPKVRPAPPPAPVQHTVIKEEARTIYFDSGKSVLTPGGQRKLNTLVEILKSAKDIQRVDIVGYADPMGSAKSNMALSERRAAAVQTYLNEHGYLNTAIAKTRAVGDTEASANCSTKLKRDKKIACLVTDRKVEIEVVYAEVVTKY